MESTGFIALVFFFFFSLPFSASWIKQNQESKVGRRPHQLSYRRKASKSHVCCVRRCEVSPPLPPLLGHTVLTLNLLGNFVFKIGWSESSLEFFRKIM